MGTQSHFDIAVIGGGPAGLMAAEVLAAAGTAVTIYDRMPTLGRKFLMAGRGGLNLTHSEPLDRFLSRYPSLPAALRAHIEAYTPDAVRTWAAGLGQETFVGSSGRVFPAAMKASPLLRAWLRRLGAAGVEMRTRHTWRGWSQDGQLRFDTPAGPVAVKADATILALGGASWPGLGSDGAWVSLLQAAGIPVVRLQQSNCGVRVDWSPLLLERHAGAPLKRIAISVGGTTVRGEAIVTASGLEGGAVYALSAALRRAFEDASRAVVTIDLRPDVPVEMLAAALSRPRGKQSLASILRKAAQLSPAAIALLNEQAHRVRRPLGALEPSELAGLIKALPIEATGLASIERAISTAGGVAWDALDPNLMLSARPGTFVAGEMLDWDAPTGGYLLQACLATGRAAGLGAAAWLAKPS